MKLVDLRRSVTGKRIMVYFDNELLGRLKPYTQRGERSGFLELSARLLLALSSNNDEILESAADHLVASCETLDDLVQLTQRVDYLRLKLQERLDDV